MRLKTRELLAARNAFGGLFEECLVWRGTR